MIGPETTNEVSAASTDGATLEAAGGVTPLETAEAAGSVPPHPPARSAAAKANHATRLRIFFLHETKGQLQLPAQPIPDFRIDPQKRLAENYIRRGIPSGANFATAFHPGSNGAVGVGDCDSGIKSRRVLDKLRFGTDDHYAAVKGARRVAVQFHDGVLAHFQQTGVAVINRQIDCGLCRVYNLGEGITQLQLASGEILNVRSRYYAIDWRTQLGFLQHLLRTRDFGFPVITLHAVDARFAAVVGGKRMIHLQHGRFEFRLCPGE